MWEIVLCSTTLEKADTHAINMLDKGRMECSELFPSVYSQQVCTGTKVTAPIMDTHDLKSCLRCIVGLV